MKTLYLTFDGLTDPLGQSQILPYLIGLSKAGHCITVLSLEKSRAFDQDSRAVQSAIHSSGLTWVPNRFAHRPPLLAPCWNLVTLARASVQAHYEQRFHAVHCRSYMASFVGLLMRTVFGCRFVFDMRGFWPDERVDGNLWNMRLPIYKALYYFFKVMENRFLLGADAVVCLTEKAKLEILKTHSALDANKIWVIPCCTDLKKFAVRASSTRERVRDELAISPHSRVLVYLGSLGTWYCLEEMMDFYRQFRERYPDSIFLLITRDSQEMVFTAACASGVEEAGIRVVSSPSDIVPDYLACADLGISFIKPTYSKLASSPTKLGEMLALGLPVVCNTGIGDLERVMASHEIGPAVANLDPEHYAAAIARCEHYFALSKEQYRETARSLFDLDEGVGRYMEIYESLSRTVS